MKRRIKAQMYLKPQTQTRSVLLIMGEIHSIVETLNKSLLWLQAKSVLHLDLGAAPLSLSPLSGVNCPSNKISILTSHTRTALHICWLEHKEGTARSQCRVWYRIEQSLWGCHKVISLPQWILEAASLVCKPSALTHNQGSLAPGSRFREVMEP